MASATNKGYALIAWDDDNGPITPGEEVVFPYETPEDKANFDRLVAMGYISTDRSQAPQPPG